MVWSYPDISFPDFMKLVKAFVDMLILASGYQSTGHCAHWDADNIKKAFQWALFLQSVSKILISSDDHADSVKELDAALSELTSRCHLPQDIANLSCVTFIRATDILLERLIHTLPLRESHFKSIMKACVELDVSQIRIEGGDTVHMYLEYLSRKPSSGMNSSQTRVFQEDFVVLSPQDASFVKKGVIENDFSFPAIHELGKRQGAALCSSAIESGLEILLKAVGESIYQEHGTTVNAERINHSSSLISEELPVESTVWNRWKSRSLSYMLDKRTIRLVSGASLIFSAPKGQWNHMFQGLNITAASNDNFCEMIELLLLGCVAERWNVLIEYLMSVSFKPLTLQRLYNDLLYIPEGESRIPYPKEGRKVAEERSIINYVEELLGGQLHQLWKISPVLAAVAIPSWSMLFRPYLLQLERQSRGNSSAIRCCSCITDEVDHRDCELAERIWCLYIFHVNGSQGQSRTNAAYSWPSF